MQIVLFKPRSDHPGYVVFGVDQHDHTRAAWFSPRERLVARLASNMAGFYLLHPPAKGSIRLREWLPRGTRLESGRFIVPRVRRGLYEKLCELEESARCGRARAHQDYDQDDQPDFVSPDSNRTEVDEAEVMQALSALPTEPGKEPDQD